MTFRLASECLLAGCLLALAACSSSSPGSPNDAQAGVGGKGASGGSSSSGGSAGQSTAGTTPGGGMGNAGTNVGGANGGGSQDAGGTGGVDPGSGGSTGTEFGFTFRAPGEKNLDWLCTFHEDSKLAHVYVRLLETGMQSAGIATVPVYSVQLAQISIDSKVSTLEGVEYEYGGGHHNDALSFNYAGKTQRYYHSSFGFGFRKCQNMDCRDIYELGSTTLETEGCGSDRTLPEVCVSFQPDGTYEPFTEFMKCAGDTE